MPQGVWTLTHLTPEQEQALKEAEARLGVKVLLAFSEGQVVPSQLDESQLEYLHDLEQKLGVTILAVERPE